jgi:hypothetical protein
MINITFIGNCQMISLCFYMQQLFKNDKNYNISWVLYSKDFIKHLGYWSIKCNNKIIKFDKIINRIINSDIIIYQNIKKNKSLFCNTETLNKLKKKSCKLLILPSIYLIYDNFDISIKKLIERENKNNVDIKVSIIFKTFRDNNLMLTNNHPNTFLFMAILQRICYLLNLNFFTEEKFNYFNNYYNYMELPI